MITLPRSPYCPVLKRGRGSQPITCILRLSHDNLSPNFDNGLNPKQAFDCLVALLYQWGLTNRRCSLGLVSARILLAKHMVVSYPLIPTSSLDLYRHGSDKALAGFLGSKHFYLLFVCLNPTRFIMCLLVLAAAGWVGIEPVNHWAKLSVSPWRDPLMSSCILLPVTAKPARPRQLTWRSC